MCNSWTTAYSKYNWRVDLTRFRGARNYPSHFNRMITPANTIEFEDRFREAIDRVGSFEAAGEVCFWKNYGNPLTRDRLTMSLLMHLQVSDNWNNFVEAIMKLSNAPSWSNFKALQKAANQPNGFATPLTFLAFYRPAEYPMVDKHIAFWWPENNAKYGYGNSPVFSQRYDGWIQPRLQSWNAYTSWTRFCRAYARLVTRNCEVNWRSRDIEMAVWEAQKRSLSLNVLQRENVT